NVPSRTAPSRTIASCERTLRPSVLSATRTQPRVSKQTRRADGASGRLPDLREHARLPAGHQRLRLANEGERLIERLRRGPREVAADLRVLHQVEEIARVSLGERLQHDVAPLECDRVERRERVR